MRRRWLRTYVRTYIFGRGGRDPQVKESKALKASNRWPLRKASTDGAQRNSSNNQRKHFCATQVAKCISQITYVRTYVHNTLLSLYNALHLKTVLSQIDFVKDVHTPGQIWGERKMEWHSAMCGHGESTCHTGRPKQVECKCGFSTFSCLRALCFSVNYTSLSRLYTLNLRKRDMVSIVPLWI